MKSANIRSSFAGATARPSACDAALDHRAGAAADHVARRLIGHRRQAFAREHDVEGVDQIGRGIDQRAVEVENDGRSGHGGSLAHDRRASGKASAAAIFGYPGAAIGAR